MELVLGIDLGTSFFKLGLFDRNGKLRGLGRVAVKTDNIDGARCELPAERFWLTLKKGLNQPTAYFPSKNYASRQAAISLIVIFIPAFFYGL